MRKPIEEMTMQELREELERLREYERETLVRVTTHDVDNFISFSYLPSDVVERLYDNVAENFRVGEELQFFVEASTDLYIG